MARNIKTMSVAEFRDAGYLQELNRRFLHPLGLALEVVVNDDGSERFGQVWDSRDDEEGFHYGGFSRLMRDKGAAVTKEYLRRAAVRYERLGFVVEPLDRDEER